ncbi:NADH dehydrogenase [ubiquinone] 1 alpha subcomplex subunit 13 isoform X1 [Gossypium hirsutum]|uniref:NADH dehydrogenase [ubiquinone] 1 alpha subcomplex subunit 13 n=1 Tax=Gossypium hirsutum TaxID=3635 RepID=A0ABM2YXX1_GOSHI|nr:NADH dehydrogenase [ubiquinone] 1 alpha subcomplex subunit 13 isoform X1 [Gossypium hirsutum]
MGPLRVGSPPSDTPVGYPTRAQVLWLYFSLLLVPSLMECTKSAKGTRSADFTLNHIICCIEHRYFGVISRLHDYRALKEEKFAARRAVLPVLQAEEDERFVKEWKKYLEYEAEVMKDVPGWKVGENVYNSGRWMPPATGELRPEVW